MSGARTDLAGLLVPMTRGRDANTAWVITRAVAPDALIEIPGGSRKKDEVDHKSGRIRLDRPLFTATQYPADYGFVEEALWDWTATRSTRSARRGTRTDVPCGVPEVSLS